MTSALLNRCLLAALLWVIASFLVHELISLDVWWHLAIGEDILRQLRVPDSNLYSAGALGRPYHDSHWLFQVMLAISHRLAGLNGALLFMIALWGLTLLILYREIRANVETGPAALLTFLAAAASAERFLPRPEIITFFMIVAFYSLLRQGRHETPAQLTLLTVLQIIWTNSHGLFVIGPFMVGCYWLVHTMRRLQGKDNRFKSLTLLLALVGGAMLISPYGIGAMEYSYLLFSEVGQQAPTHMKAVNELSPTFGAASRSAPAFWFYAVLLVLAPLSLAFNLRRIPPERLLIIIALCLAGFSGRRNMALFALAAAPFIAENLSQRLSRLSPHTAWGQGLKALLTAGLLLWSLYPLSGRYYLDMELPGRFGLGVTPDFFPHGVVAFIREHNIQGQVYNSNRLGGFYLYHFYPDRIPFVDGRWEIYGEDFFKQRQTALQSYSAWKRWAANYGISSALLLHTDAESRLLVPELYRDPQWSLVYYDFAAAFFVRNDRLGSARPIVFSSATPLLEGDVRLDSRLILNLFYYNLGIKHLLLANLERNRGMGFEKDNSQLAKLYMEFNRSSEAEALYQKILDEQPHHLDALSDLSLIHYQRGHYEQALAYTARAVAAAPHNLDLRFNHALVLLALKRQPEAAGMLRQILAVQPGYLKARQLLQQIDP